MKVRAYGPEDARHLAALLRRIWGADRQALGYYRFGPDSPPESTGFSRTLVAEAGGRPVGFGTAWTNPFHPHALYVGVNVDPVMQRNGYGTRLLGALAKCHPHPLPLQGSTWETSIGGIRFLTRLGFQEVRRTWEPDLDAGGVDVQAYRRYEERCLRRGYVIAGLPERAGQPGHEEKLAALLAEVYTATHSINPPRQMELSGWVDLLRQDPPDPAFTFLALRDGHYVAICAAHRDESGPPILTWSGVTAGERLHGQDLIMALTLRQVVHAGDSGATVLWGEFDNTNPWAVLQMKGFPFRPAPGWITFQRMR